MSAAGGAGGAAVVCVMGVVAGWLSWVDRLSVMGVATRAAAAMPIAARSALCCVVLHMPTSFRTGSSLGW